MPIYFWVTVILVSIILLILLIGTIIVLGIIKPKKRSLLETSILEEEKFPGIMDFYKENLNKQYTIKSRYNYDIQLYFLKNKEESNKYIVMSHGHTYTHHGCLKYARMMMNYGYNIILYDQRFHGNSGGKFTSLGYYEKDDLYDIITDSYDRYKDIIIGTYGESMGASTVLLEAAMDARVKFVMADCGFKNLEVLLKEILYKNYGFPLKYFMFSAKLMFKLLVGVEMNRISPEKALNTLTIPVFIAHGEADDFIPVHHSIDMYENYKGKKTLFVAKNDAHHAGSYLKNPVEYENSIRQYSDKYIY